MPIDVLCDNDFAINLVVNPVLHEKIKYFEIDVRF